MSIHTLKTQQCLPLKGIGHDFANFQCRNNVMLRPLFHMEIKLRHSTTAVGAPYFASDQGCCRCCRLMQLHTKCFGSWLFTGK